jgi:hypothetical protein
VQDKVEKKKERLEEAEVNRDGERAACGKGRGTVLSEQERKYYITY